MKGVTTEMSGRTLAKVEVVHWCETTLFLGWVAMFLHLGQPDIIVLAVAVAALAFFLGSSSTIISRACEVAKVPEVGMDRGAGVRSCQHCLARVRPYRVKEARFE